VRRFVAIVVMLSACSAIRDRFVLLGCWEGFWGTSPAELCWTPSFAPDHRWFGVENDRAGHIELYVSELGVKVPQRYTDCAGGGCVSNTKPMQVTYDPTDDTLEITLEHTIARFHR
jgi:hypothetical protein